MLIHGFSTLIWNWNVDQGHLYLNLDLLKWRSKVFSTSTWTAEMLIKDLLYLNLELLKYRSKVFSTPIWNCWNVNQRSSLLQFGIIETSIKGLLYSDLDKMLIKGFLYSNLELFKLDMAKRVRIFSPNPKNMWPEPNFFYLKQKRVDPWPNPCFLQVDLTQPELKPFLKLFFWIKK